MIPAKIGQQRCSLGPQRLRIKTQTVADAFALFWSRLFRQTALLLPTNRHPACLGGSRASALREIRRCFRSAKALGPPWQAGGGVPFVGDVMTHPNLNFLPLKPPPTFILQ